MKRVRIVQADITTLDVDAVVNAANDHLWMGAGVAGAIKRAGGEEIERDAIAQGPIAVGEAVVTGAGRLRARHVIHAAAMGQDLVTDARKIRSATASALRRADELGLRSIAFPALGTGVGGFPVAECARVMIDAAGDALARAGALEEVVFALRSPDAVHAFESALGGAERVVG
ncbi:MAG TPA: macro domain-containing protein [Candidatus Dormibacteraeota bacterium]|nr:macro domain-containing protein [Candidatus Dormibacteraeota bacterium]